MMRDLLGTLVEKGHKVTRFYLWFDRKSYVLECVPSPKWDIDERHELARGEHSAVWFCAQQFALQLDNDWLFVPVEKAYLTEEKPENLQADDTIMLVGEYWFVISG
jgi:hypothetical protein